MKVITGVVREGNKVLRRPIILVERTCKFCGKIFEPKCQRSTCCSHLCSKRQSIRNTAEKNRERAKRWHYENLEYANERRREKYRENPEYFKQKQRERRERNKEQIKQYDTLYKDETRHGGMRAKLIEENGLKCSGCGMEGDRFTIVAHHTTFDNQEHENQILLCRSCHGKIHNS